MQVTRFNNSTEYYQRVESYLLQNEATNCLLLGIAKSLYSSQSGDRDQPYLVTLENNKSILATAIQTPPWRLLLAKSTDIEAVKLIAKNITLENKSLPGVIGLKSEAEIFARTWQSIAGRTFKLAIAMKIHQLETLQPITFASGRLRLAQEGDRHLLLKWIEAFELEALGIRDNLRL